MTVSDQKKISKVIGEKYDEIPYVSYPFEYNRPENLRAIGALFGMNPAKLEKARVLELGCAAGGNLIRFSEIYPESYTLGVDLSAVEVKCGMDTIKTLGLTNIELKSMSITDLDESYGKFDYIICHGVYSWVPEFVREKILEISNKLLAKDGIVFISYNTLPGWNMVRTVRELMVYHASNFETEQDRISQARHILSFLKESLEGSETPYSNFMKEWVVTVLDKANDYVRHEFLAEENKAFYFHEFIEEARKHDLEYVGDSDLHRMYVGNLPANAAEKLGSINDIVKTEQYIDFIKNTQFRCTLLCHKDTQLSRNITFDRVKQLYLTCLIDPEEPETKDVYNSTHTSKFYINNSKDVFLSTSSPALKAMLYVFADNIANPLSVNELVDLTFKKAPNFSKEHIELEIANNAPKFIFSGYFKTFADKPVFKYDISNKPKISDYAAYQISICPQNGKYWFTNQTNTIIPVEEYNVYVLKLLDGKHTLDDVKKEIFQNLKDGVLNANKDNKKIEDEKELKEVADKLVMDTLEYLRINYSLVG